MLPSTDNSYDYSSEEERLHHIREREYPSLKNAIYLDHAGTTPIPKCLIDRFSADMVANLYGNPHSASPSSQLSMRRVEETRHSVLRFFNADPLLFDIVFVANATAGIKLVAEAFRDTINGFWFAYHKDSHTSIVGARELADAGSQCFTSDEDVEDWLANPAIRCQASGCEPGAELFAYPAQSNMNGRRLPLDWCHKLRETSQRDGKKRYSLVDAAAYVSTSPLDLSDASKAPDFAVLSFYKIFGFPDLGALIVRRDSADVFKSRKYFGGGTVDMVLSIKEQWHAPKTESVHSMLEDGTLPIHSIISLSHGIDVQRELYGSLSHISKRTAILSSWLYSELGKLFHSNGQPLCVIYKNPKSTYGDSLTQGPVVAFNMRNSSGGWIINAEVEKLASIKNIHLRAGGLCNPGGIVTSLGLEPWEMRRNFSAGHRCASDNELVSGKPTGMLRVSLGASSTMEDITEFIDFLKEFFVEVRAVESQNPAEPLVHSISASEFCIESLTVYPIKSCAGWKVPLDVRWDVRKEGLAWDREWCLVHSGTGKALSQKQYPRMALLQPRIDMAKGVLTVRFCGRNDYGSESLNEISVPLSADPRYFECSGKSDECCTVCGDDVPTAVYTSQRVTEFFSSALDVPCRLVRFSSQDRKLTSRQAKARFQEHQNPAAEERGDPNDSVTRPILLSNESPILMVSRSSLNRLNERIKARGGKAVQAEAFRANVVVAETPMLACGTESPYIEDHWRALQIGTQYYEMLGSCRRCQMVCVDQTTAQKTQEPFVTLARTRRFEGKVWFGQHMCHLASVENGRDSAAGQRPTIMVGDAVKSFFSGQEADVILKKCINNTG